MGACAIVVAPGAGEGWLPLYWLPWTVSLPVSWQSLRGGWWEEQRMARWRWHPSASGHKQGNEDAQEQWGTWDVEEIHRLYPFIRTVLPITCPSHHSHMKGVKCRAWLRIVTIQRAWLRSHTTVFVCPHSRAPSPGDRLFRISQYLRIRNGGRSGLHHEFMREDDDDRAYGIVCMKGARPCTCSPRSVTGFSPSSPPMNSLPCSGCSWWKRWVFRYRCREIS